jgi:lipid II:glycine glycyltransferase (peptidoglycan interpeptide bridge formation enzyme)
VSLPFSDHCQPIVPGGNDCQEIIGDIIDYGNKAGWKYIEWRDGENCFKNIIPSSFYIGHILALKENDQELLSGFRSSTRRNIKKAVKKGVEVGLHYSLDSIRVFNRLNNMTRKMHGLPPQPFYFFKDIYRHIISQKKGCVVLAFFDKRPVAGAVYFHIGDKAFFKYGASDRKYQHLRPNNLVMWEAIRWYARNGFNYLSFGRTDPENQGLLQFKQGWGTREVNINYYRYSLERNTFVGGGLRGRTSYGFFQKLPSPLLHFIGFLFYRHVG